MDTAGKAEKTAKVWHPSYVGVFVALAAMTGAELLVAFLPWPKTVIIGLLIFLAVWKALLVALYYMHLRFEPKGIRWMVVVPLPLAVILVVTVITEFFW